MGKRRPKNVVRDIFEGTVSATECTGIYQHISLDTDEIAEFHKKFIEEEEGND